ncbi:MAG: hypothetical protein COT73_06015 [Bdellovibrio sp. CG10_big_fil_rev_8_21_14_0_10_47_8]|nr:MAG: hypothetical protein COT73_06015 [Bdellovibrio sp. CG10_big_fil_rev_8_21_14_0_10_47_8]
MSIKKVALISMIGFCVGYLGIYFWNSADRSPASVDLPAPKLKLKPWAHSPFGKINQAFEVKISVIGGIPETDDQELRLRAQVTLNHPVQNGELTYHWILPEGASVVSGELEDSWPGVQPGQTATTEISVLGVSKEGLAKNVTLNVNGSSQGVQYANSGSFATNIRPEWTEEAVGSDESQNQMEELVLRKNESAATLNKEKMEKAHQ